PPPEIASTCDCTRRRVRISTGGPHGGTVLRSARRARRARRRVGNSHALITIVAWLSSRPRSSIRLGYEQVGPAISTQGAFRGLRRDRICARRGACARTRAEPCPLRLEAVA